LEYLNAELLKEEVYFGVYLKVGGDLGVGVRARFYIASVYVYFDFPEESCHSPGSAALLSWMDYGLENWELPSASFDDNWIAAYNFSFSGLSSIHRVSANIFIYSTLDLKRGLGPSQYDNVTITTLALGEWNEEKTDFTLQSDVSNGWTAYPLSW